LLDQLDATIMIF